VTPENMRPSDPYFGHFWIAAAQTVGLIQTIGTKQLDEVALAKRIGDLAAALMADASKRADWPL
jgi:mRNA-degrading endonuclease toxin of MazEF toxin-antitoxin module